MIVLAIIIAVFTILFSLSITFRVLYTDNFRITVGIGKLKYTLLPAPEKEKKVKEKSEKGDIKETVLLVLDIVKSVLPPVFDLLKKVRITSLCVDITVGGDDAAQTAINYGRINAIFHSSLSALRNLVKVKAKRIKIDCDFLKPETEQRIFFKMKIRIFFIIIAALRMGYRFLGNTLKRKKNKDKN